MEEQYVLDAYIDANLLPVLRAVWPEASVSDVDDNPELVHIRFHGTYPRVEALNIWCDVTAQDCGKHSPRAMWRE